MGKTTLAAMAPSPVFLGFDDGGRETLHPKTGEKLRHIPGVESFQDLRDVLHSPNLISAGSTIVLDTITDAEERLKQHMLLTVKKESGQYASSIEDYGYGKGFNHLTDTARILTADLDGPIRRGVHVILLAQQAQATVANLEGLDYSKDGPSLTSQPKGNSNVRSVICSWVSNIFRIGYPSVEVAKANKEAKKGKASGTTDRVVYTEPEVYFEAKNRCNGRLPAMVSFATRDDDSIWRMVFDGQFPEPEAT